MFILAVLWTGFFLVNFNIAMMIPLMPFAQAALGLSTREAGWVLAVFPVTALVGNLALGPWIDRFGRKRFIVAGAAGCAVVFLLTALSGGAAMLIACRAAVGLTMPMMGASLFAAVADYMPAERRARASGYVTTAAPIAFLLTMSGGMVLGGLVSWRAPLLLASALSAVQAVCATRLPPTPREMMTTGWPTLRTYRARLLSLSLGRETRLLFAGYFCWSAAVFTFLGLYPAWLVRTGLAGEGPAIVGTILFLGEVGGLLGALMAARAGGWTAKPLAVCAVAAFATGVLVLGIPLGHGMKLAEALVYCGFAFGRDLMLAFILGGAMRLVPPEQRGSLNATSNAVYQIGATLGMLASARLYGFEPGFWGNALAASVLFCLSGLSLRRIRGG